MADDRLDYLTKPNVFIDGPGDLLCKFICAEIVKVPQFKKIFSNADGIVPYQKDDFSYQALPAMRCYSERINKEHESHYIMGEVTIDVIFPPSLRREELQVLQDKLSSALMQQFRRPPFFMALRCVLPGLNELGKTFSVDKTLGMMLSDNFCPVTQIVLNFRLDLKEWDDYLEREGRTKEQPFEVTLGDLERIVSEIQGLNDNETVNVTVPIDQTIGGNE